MDWNWKLKKNAALWKKSCAYEHYFQPIPTNIPFVNSDIFSEACNRQRLHEIIASISLGPGSILEKFWLTEYPVISTLRWLTSGERICGVFIREPNPSEELKIMMAFIAGAYAPAHMNIFLNPAYEDQSHHFLDYIMNSKVNIFKICEVVNSLIRPYFVLLFYHMVPLLLWSRITNSGFDSKKDNISNL